jgi:hypothetical protein
MYWNVVKGLPIMNNTLSSVDRWQKLIPNPGIRNGTNRLGRDELADAFGKTRNFVS